MHSTADGQKLYRCGVEFAKPNHVQFITDMEAKKHPIKLLSIYGYSGPCVTVPASAKDVILSLTSVKCGLLKRTSNSVILFPLGSCDIIASVVKNQPWLKVKV